MAQLVLTLAGSSLGNAIGGGLGGSIVALMGSMAGAVIDQELFGPPAARRKVEGTRVSDIRLSGSAFGLGIPMVYGRGRLPANVIWARGIREEVRTTTERAGGSSGKGGIGGGGSRGEIVTTTSYHYFADVALGIGEGPVTSIYRIWVDGQPLDPEHVGEIRLYYGDEEQTADPLIQAIEGADRTSAYRGLAYVVLENLYLTPFGNRFPNFEVEVFRGSGEGVPDARHLVQGVCLIPASGAWAYDPELAFSTRHKPPSAAPGAGAALNAHSGQKRADFAVAIDNLGRELPNVEWISLVYAWFGTSTDLAVCSIRPEAEVGVYQDQWPDTRPEPWTVMGIGRPIFGPGGATLPIPHWPTVSSYTKPDGSLGLFYGGTIADAAMVRAIQHLRARGYKVLFYPFLMMDVPPPDPAPFPWRGRITGAAADLAGFFERPDGYLRFVRHCMTLCEEAGGVEGFAVGSEMVGLNRIRDSAGSYPAVPFWRQLAAEAKTRLGSACLITYAADWSEYRYHDRGSGTVDFPLDPLWADPNVDVVGIDAYFPVTDEARATYDKEVIKAGWAGGELVDYFYADPTDRDLNRRGYDPARSAIDDPFYALKDIRSWWAGTHRPRVNGVPTGPATAWVPQGKPIWFTEYGFPTVNCATNQPNVFIDPKSVESFAPYYSNAAVDRVVQRAAIEATEEFWSDPANNPVSSVYGGPMLGRRLVWCWDARPYPWFPTLSNVWSDGANYRLGHWIEGKIGNMRLSEIVADLCRKAGLGDDEFDADALDDEVVGYVVTERKAIRDMIAVLQTAYFFDAVERGGVLMFVKRGAGDLVAIDAEDLGASDGDADRSRLKLERTQDTELPIAVDIVHTDEGRDYQSSTVTVRKQVGQSDSVTTFSLPLVLSVEQAQVIGQRALREIWQGREAIDLRLPTRALAIDPTDLVEVPVDGATRTFRVASVTYGKPGLVLVRGVAAGGNPEFVGAGTGSGAITPAVPEPVGPVRVELLDMPLMIEAHEASAPSFYMAACPLGGGRFRGASLFRPTSDGLDYTVAAVVVAPSVIGNTATVLGPGPAHAWDNANSVEVQLAYGTLESLPESRLLDGANGAIVGDEVIQFATATLIAAGRYRLSRLLRGRLGTEHRIVSHPVGSRFVLLDPGRQVRPTFSLAGVGQPIAWRVAPIPQGPDGDLSDSKPFTDGGEGLRPWSPVHLRGSRNGAGDLAITWVRRTRFGGWWRDLTDVPSNEESERYELDILNGATVVRTLAVTQPAATYTAGQQTSDFGSPQVSVSVRVAQISAAVGRGSLASAVL